MQTNVGRIIVGLLLALGAANHGHAAVGTWAPTGPGGGGPFTALMVSPQSSGVVYVGSYAGAVKSTDGGFTWAHKNAGILLPGASANGLAIDPSNGNRLFQVVNGAQVLYRSNDAGETWTPMASGPFTLLSTVAVDPNNSNVVFAGDYSPKVYKSVDGGFTFSSGTSLGYPTSVTTLSVEPSSPLDVAVGTNNGIWTSTDGGSSFTLRTTGIGQPSIYSMARDPFAPGTIVVASGYGLYRSTDNGLSWTGLRAGAHFGVAFDPAASGTFYASTWGGVVVSHDNGATWTTLSAGFPAGSYPTSLALDANVPGTLYVGMVSLAYPPTTPTGIYKTTTSGSVWFDTGVNLDALITTDVRFNASGTLLFAASGNGIHRSTDGGVTWVVANSGLSRLDIRSLATDPSMPSRVLAGTETAGLGTSLFQSTDGGGTWNASDTGIPSGAGVSSIAIDRTNSARAFVAARSAGVYRTLDGGSSWSSANVGLAGVDVLKVVVDPFTTTTLYAGATNGSFLYRSADGGASWAPSNTGIANWVYDIAADPVAPGVLYAGTNGGVFKSTNGGASWTPDGPSVLPTLIFSIAVDPENPAHVYAAAFGAGVFFSADAGATWTAIDSGLSTWLVETVAVHPTMPGRVFAGTFGASAFVGDFPGICGNGVVEYGEQCDGGVCCTNSCQFESATVVCRAAGGTCDVAEYCTGASGACTADAKSTAVCRPSAGVCDVAESCDGVGNDCPADAKSTVVCRPAADACDIAESCDGLSNDCPADAVLPDHDGDGLCDAIDPCTLGATANKPSLQVSRLLPPAGDEQFKLSGVVTIPTTPNVNPLAHGLRVLIATATGATLFDETLPPGAYDQGARAGWKRNASGTVWTFLDKGGFTSTTKASLKGTAATPGLYKVQVSGAGAHLPITQADLPLEATVVVDQPLAMTGQCGEFVFPGAPGPRCTLVPSGSILQCK